MSHLPPRQTTLALSLSTIVILLFKSTIISFVYTIPVPGVVPAVLFDVRDHKYRDPVLLSDSLQDPGLAHSAPGDAAGGPGPDVDHPLAERGHVQPGAGLHHVW